MDHLREKIDLLNQVDRNWLQIMKREWESDEPLQDKTLVNAFNEFFTETRNRYKEDEVSVTEFFRKIFDHSADWILEEVRKSLRVFYLLSVFRMINNRNSEMGKRIIDYCFDYVILRFDPQFAGNYEDFGYETLQEFLDTARCLDGLVEYYVTRHWTQNAIVRDLKAETGLSEQICAYISFKMEENYHTLQMNTLMDMMHE